MIFSGTVDEAANQVKARNKEGDAVKVEKILHELLHLDETYNTTLKDPDATRRSLVKLRLKLLSELFSNNNDSSSSSLTDDSLLDVSNFLRDTLTHHTLPSVMNISQVRLPPTYNFYLDPLP